MTETSTVTAPRRWQAVNKTALLTYGSGMLMVNGSIAPWVTIDDGNLYVSGVQTGWGIATTIAGAVVFAVGMARAAGKAWPRPTVASLVVAGLGIAAVATALLVAVAGRESVAQDKRLATGYVGVSAGPGQPVSTHASTEVGAYTVMLGGALAAGAALALRVRRP